MRDRHGEATALRSALDAEIAEIEGALSALGARSLLESTPADAVSTGTATAGETPSRKRQAGKSTRGAVRELLDLGPRAFDNREVADTLDHLRGDRSNDGWRAAIRTAMWTLRNDGHAALTDDGKTISVKWLKDTEGPAVTGPSDDAGTDTEGGEARETAHRYQDSLPRWNGSHGRDPAVVG